MYYIILIIVMTSLTTINLTTKFVKQEINKDKETKENKETKGLIKEYYLYIIAAIGGAIGNVFLYFTINELREFDKNHKYRFIIINTLLVGLNALIIYLIYLTGILKI